MDSRSARVTGVTMRLCARVRVHCRRGRAKVDSCRGSSGTTPPCAPTSTPRGVGGTRAAHRRRAGSTGPRRHRAPARIPRLRSRAARSDARTRRGGLGGGGPALFHHEPAHSDSEVFGETLFAAFDATFDWLVGRGIYPDCVGVLGFDDAGTAALLVATNRPVGAAVSVSAHGIVAPLTDDTPALVDAAPSLGRPGWACTARTIRGPHPSTSSDCGMPWRGRTRPPTSSATSDSRTAPTNRPSRSRRRTTTIRSWSRSSTPTPDLRLVRQQPEIGDDADQAFCVCWRTLCNVSPGGSETSRPPRRRARAAEWDSLLMSCPP